MADIHVKSAFVEDTIGSPVFVLKVAEPHSRKREDGSYETVSRTFMDVKVSRDSGIDLSQFQKGDRIQFQGRQKTEVREHEGKKYYTLAVWADRIEVVSRPVPQGGFQQSAGATQSGFVGGSSGQGGFGAQEPAWNEEAPF